MKTSCKKGNIFDIQRFSVHDGPGIRTLVFFKGCPLRCRWCSNPESQASTSQLFVVKANCIGCGACAKVCEVGAVFHNADGINVDRHKCRACGRCSKVCYTEALTMTGREWTVAQLMEELEKDEIHYQKSNGGITLSGGEALAQPEFAHDLLKACQGRGWHTALETSGFANVEVWDLLLPYLDMVLFDIKHLEKKKHRDFIGKGNEKILQSVTKVASATGVELIIRVPVILGFNDQATEIAEIAAFAKSLEVQKLHLLPYHPYGEQKYGDLGMKATDLKFEIPSDTLMKQLKSVVEKFGIICQIGG